MYKNIYFFFLIIILIIQIYMLSFLYNKYIYHEKLLNKLIIQYHYNLPLYYEYLKNKYHSVN